MSTTTTKNILLSQPKVGQFGENPTTVLTHDVSHSGESTVVKVEVPGVDPETISVICDNHVLHVSCERGEVTVGVDPTVDASKINADIVWGLLTVTIPMPPPPTTRTIKVNMHDTVKKTVSKSHSKFTEELERV